MSEIPNHPYFFNNNLKAYQLLIAEVIPKVADSFKDDANFSIWNPTAKSGQETFSLLIGADSKLRRDILQKIVVFASSKEEGDVSKIREGIFSGMEVQKGLPIKLLLKYFEQLPDKTWKVVSKLMGKVTVATHDFSGEALDKKHHLIFAPDIFASAGASEESVLSHLEAGLVPNGILFTISECSPLSNSDKWQKHESDGFFYYSLK